MLESLLNKVPGLEGSTFENIYFEEHLRADASAFVHLNKLPFH